MADEITGQLDALHRGKVAPEAHAAAMAALADEGVLPGRASPGTQPQQDMEIDEGVLGLARLPAEVRAVGAAAVPAAPATAPTGEAVTGTGAAVGGSRPKRGVGAAAAACLANLACGGGGGGAGSEDERVEDPGLWGTQLQKRLDHMRRAPKLFAVDGPMPSVSAEELMRRHKLATREVCGVGGVGWGGGGRGAAWGCVVSCVGGRGADCGSPPYANAWKPHHQGHQGQGHSYVDGDGGATL